jgi:hypothetical protein
MTPFSFHDAVERLQAVCRGVCRFLGLLEVLASKARLLNSAGERVTTGRYASSTTFRASSSRVSGGQ